MAVNYFDLTTTNNEKKEFMSDLNKINLLSKKLEEELLASTVDELIYLHERMAISYRHLLQGIALDDNFELFYKRNINISKKELLKFVRENIKIKIEKLSINGAPVLHIQTPFLFRRSVKKSFYLSEYLNVKLSEILKEEKEYLNDFACKNNLYVLRLDEKVNFGAHCDNDNLELSELINRLFGHIGISDNPSRMSFYSDVIVNDKQELQGIHLFLIPYRFGLFESEKLVNLITE